MNLNPEFQRQLYLEYSPARLIGIPMVLGVIFTFSYFIDGYSLGSATANASLSLFMLITLLWGARQAVDSIVEEYRDRTWDTQRLSALGPWRMTWGKLFGSTLMVWYAGALCLFVYSLATESRSTLPTLMFYGICAALLVQSASLLLGLLAVRRGQTKSSSVLILAVIGFLSIAPWLSELSNLAVAPVPSTHWYDMRFNGRSFHQISLLLALFWCMAGNYRLMMLELGLRTVPWAWLGFSLFLIIYLGGFIPGSSYSFYLSALLVCGALTYLGVAVETNDAMRVKRLLTYLAQRNWRRGFEELPIWWLTFLLMPPTALVLSWSDHPLREFSLHFHFYPLAIVLLVLRDCGIYLYFHYGKNPQRALSLTLLAAVLLYGILPGIFNAMAQNGMAALFFPLWADTAGGALLRAILQTAVVMSLLYRRWKAST